MERSFPTTIDSLEAIFAFAEEFFARHGIDPANHFAVTFALEELFTNVVKYSLGAGNRVRIDLDRLDDRIRVRLVSFDVDHFDPTTAPQPDVNASVEDRKVGGLGLFLTRKVMDTMEYEYAERDRTSTITLTKKLG